MQSVLIVHCTDRTNRQIHHDPKDTLVVERLKVSHITYTDRQHSHTTREYIRRSVRVIQLVNHYAICTGHTTREYITRIRTIREYHYTIRAGHTTCEYIKRSLRVVRLVNTLHVSVRLVNTLHDLYG